MISSSRIMATLPVENLGRAEKFYHDVLGLKIHLEEPRGVIFESSDGSTLYLYQRERTMADHTVASFQVKDIASEVRELRRNRRIKFEEYDIPEMGIKTVDGIATMTGAEYETKSAWFKDTEGNILALVQMVRIGT